MREHRRRHLRVLRLRKTDYTAGHLLAANTASRHWKGGDSRDDGFSYSFEEDRGHSRRLGTQSNNQDRRGITNYRTSLPVSCATHTAPPHATMSLYCHSPSPKGNAGSRKRRGSRTGVKSAPRLPSLSSSGCIHVGGNPQDCPTMEQCRLAKEKLWSNEGGDRGSDSDGDNVGSKDLLESCTVSSDHQEEADKKRRPSPEGAMLEGDSSWRESLHHGPFSQSARSFDSVGDRIGGGSGAGRTGARRGTGSSEDSLSRPESSRTSSDTMEFGSHRTRRFKGWESDRVKKNTGDPKKLTSEKNLDKTDDKCKIFNTFTRPDKNDGVRVLVQAAKPLKVKLSFICGSRFWEQ